MSMNSLTKGDGGPYRHMWTNLSYKLNYTKVQNHNGLPKLQALLPIKWHGNHKNLAVSSGSLASLNEK